MMGHLVLDVQSWIDNTRTHVYNTRNDMSVLRDTYVTTQYICYRYKDGDIVSMHIILYYKE